VDLPLHLCVNSSTQFKSAKVLGSYFHKCPDVAVVMLWCADQPFACCFGGEDVEFAALGVPEVEVGVEEKEAFVLLWRFCCSNVERLVRDVVLNDVVLLCLT
jgi:hypothetical protein